MEEEEEATYTVEQAEALLPELRERLGRIRESRQVVFAAAERIRGRLRADGGGEGGSDYWNASATLKAEVEYLASLGIVLRDPETGLVDFPGERGGRRVFLCWRLDEERVGFWHEIDSGFRGRKPL